MTSKIIWITTTKYSTLFQRILQTYTENVEIVVDGKHYADADLLVLLTTWCTNKRIKQTHNFQLSQCGRELFGFHDGPAELWAAYTELPFVQQLRAERLIRYEVVEVVPSRSMFASLKAVGTKLFARHSSK